jgi:hypothetical protein
MKTFFCQHNRDKADPYTKVLLENGYQETKDIKTSDFIIIDHNWGDDVMEYLRWTGKPIFMILHGLRGSMFWDARYKIHPIESCYFLPAKGYIGMFRQGGYPANMKAVGFPWCEVKPFQPTTMRKILFAPIHPDDQGYHNTPEHADKNSQVWSILKEYAKDYQITVYNSLKSEKKSGITKIDNVRYIPSSLSIDGALKMINQADIVISFDTFAFLSVASGKPTMMMDEYQYPPNKEPKKSLHWEIYEKSYKYPYTFLNMPGDPLSNMLQCVKDGSSIQEWKDNFIGNNFDKDLFLNTIKEYTDE